MSIAFVQNFPALAMVPGLVAYFAAGVGLGAVYFNAIWWNARLFARSGLGVAAIALVIGRFVLLGGALVLASLQGAAPLLAMALGVLAIRPVIMRRHRAAPL
ncbi:MAG: ATP synthase subunit I [Beijerinckiaceae bacterium]